MSLSSKKIKIRRELKKSQLVLFGLGFGVIGAIILVYSFALEPSSSPVAADTEIDGQVAFTHADPIPPPVGSKVKPQPIPWNVVLTSKKTYYLDLPPGQQPLTSGEHVKVKGKLKDNRIAVDNKGIQAVAEPPSAHPVKATLTQKTTGTIRLLVINADKSSLSMGSVMSTVNSTFNTVSYGKASFSYTMVGPYTNLVKSCFYDVYSVIAAADPAVNYTQYDDVLIIAPDIGCGVGGFASTSPLKFNTQEGEVKLAYASVTDLTSDHVKANIVNHELGHTLGEQHSNTMGCPNNGPPTLALNDMCMASKDGYGGAYVIEYGDATSIMGSDATSNTITPTDMSAPERDLVGWFSSGNVKQVTQSGNYTIESIEPSTTNLKALTMQRNTCPTERLWVNFQPSVGVGVYFNSAADGKSTIYAPDGCGDLDMLGRHYRTNVLKAGQQMTDPNTGVVVRVISIGSSSATVNVQVNRTDFTPPTVSFVTPADALSGMANLQANVSDDSSGVGAVDYYIDTLFIGTATSAPWSMPYDTTKLANGSHSIFLLARDKAGDPWGGRDNQGESTQSSFKVQNANNDTTPPDITLTAPTGCTTITKDADIFVSATATDDRGVTSVEFRTDNRGIQTLNSPPYSYTWIDPAAGVYHIWAIASDAAGNQRTTTAQVTVIKGTGSCTPDTTPPTITYVPLKPQTVVSGTSYPIAILSSDNIVVTKVEFYIDGQIIKTFYEGTFTSINWDSTTVPDGPHTFSAKVYDGAGNSASSDTVPFTVSNGVTNPPPPPPKIGDCDGNGTVDLLDLSSLLGNWGTNFPACDFDKSGSVDLLDLSSLLGNWTG